MKEIENQAMPSLFKNYQQLMRLVNRQLRYGRISMQNDQGHHILGHFILDPNPDVPPKCRRKLKPRIHGNELRIKQIKTIQIVCLRL